MTRYAELHDKIRDLRKNGLTYSEINAHLGVSIHKSTYSYICRGVALSTSQRASIQAEQLRQLGERRKVAVLQNKRLFNQKISSYRLKHHDMATFMSNLNAKLLALAMLYWGEGSKWKSHRGPQLGSSNPDIIRLYIALLHDCYGVTIERIKCRVQHRADQDSQGLIAYWSTVTGIKPGNFYPCYIDKRTLGQVTRKENYRGVCVITCAGTHIQLELAQIVDIIVEAL